ncbi:ketose-bisphosphate aldolase [Brachybacterium sp. NPDC056505]|uniref:class II fructose-bisphosphate aldolase n=1 Tax=Brachybacterium sp. NPDC056505 TaxID=3345843 RepID=UPI00367151F6
MYVTLSEVLTEAERIGSTVGAFNAHNLEMIPPMILAARDAGSPIIIQTSVGTARYIGMENLVALCRGMAEREPVDVVLHLDHATKLEDIRDAIDAGYSSVMFDGSSLPFAENVLKTRRVVEFARERGVSVEGEIGTIGGTEDGISVAEGALTSPEEARAFHEATGVDALAVSIGTHHGSYKGKTQIDVGLVERIHAAVDVPLVVHGGTGVDEADYDALRRAGVRKFNIGTELIVGWTRAAKETFGATEVNASLRNNIVPANDAVAGIVRHKIGCLLPARIS